jgi:hypothetical protein
MSILILTLCLSHCAISTTDMINISAAVYGGMEKNNITNIDSCLNREDMCIK